MGDPFAIHDLRKENSQLMARIIELERHLRMNRNLQDRVEELELKLTAVCEFAVADWNDQVVGQVESVVPHEKQRTYADRLRALFVDGPAERDALRAIIADCPLLFTTTCNAAELRWIERARAATITAPCQPSPVNSGSKDSPTGLSPSVTSAPTPSPPPPSSSTTECRT